jgi:hypothetical protein
MNLCNALSMLGRRESGTAQLEEAINSWDACLTVASSAWLPGSVQTVRANRNDTQVEIARRSANKHVFAKLNKNAPRQSSRKRGFSRDASRLQRLKYLLDPTNRWDHERRLQ